jgi:hypothetical protein
MLSVMRRPAAVQARALSEDADATYCPLDRCVSDQDQMLAGFGCVLLYPAVCSPASAIGGFSASRLRSAITRSASPWWRSAAR